MELHEDGRTEFKREWAESIRKTVIAFANTEGGTLWVGVDDDGNAVGKDDADGLSLRVCNMVRDSIRPDLSMFVNCERAERDGKTVLRVEVQRGTDRPYFAKAAGLRPERCFRPAGRGCVGTAESRHSENRNPVHLRLARSARPTGFHARITHRLHRCHRFLGALRELRVRDSGAPEAHGWARKGKTQGRQNTEADRGAPRGIGLRAEIINDSRPTPALDAKRMPLPPCLAETPRLIFRLRLATPDFIPMIDIESQTTYNELQNGDIVMAQVSFRMDDELKAEAEELFRSMGMNMSSAITIFVTQSVRQHRFPLEIKADPFYSESNLSVLRRRARDMDAGRNVSEHEPVDAGEPAHA